MNRPLSLGRVRTCKAQRIWGRGGENIVGGYGSANALEFKLPNWLDRDGILDRHQHARADQNLTGLGFVAQPRCDVGHRPDGGIVEASLEADGAERRVSVRYADAKADLVAQPTPLLSQCSNSIAHFERHQHSLERWVLDRHRIIEDHHHPVARVPFERAAVPDNDLADGRMVFAQQSHHVFWVGSFPRSR